MTWNLETSGSFCGCYRRHDGATVFPRLTRWGATAPTDRSELVGRNGVPRRWNSAEAAMAAVDRELPPTRSLDAVQARIVTEMSVPVSRRGNVRETVKSVLAAFQRRSMTAFARSSLLAVLALHSTVQNGPIGDERASYSYSVNGCRVVASIRDNGAVYARRASFPRWHGPYREISDGLEAVSDGC